MYISGLLKNVKSNFVAFLWKPELMTPVNFTNFKFNLQAIHSMTPVDFTKKMFEFLAGFLIFGPTLCTASEDAEASKARRPPRGSFRPTHSEYSQSSSQFGKMCGLTLGFLPFFPKALAFHFLAIQHCNWNQFYSCNFEFPRISNSSDGFTNFL